MLNKAILPSMAVFTYEKKISEAKATAIYQHYLLIQNNHKNKSAGLMEK